MIDKFNYEEFGFKVGFEIYRQFDIKKLFFFVLSEFSDEVDFIFERRLRFMMSELGEIDFVVLEEFKKGRKYIYEGNYRFIDFVYMDEELLRGFDREVFEVVFQIGYFFNVKLVDEVYFMRKIVIDGFNVFGFQRMVIVVVNGKVDIFWGSVGILIVCFEEDVCCIVERKEKEVIYCIDCFGILLVEISIILDIYYFEQVKVVVKYIGDVLRVMRKVKCGFGIIRQDFNVLIRGGVRVEIKGVQEFDMILFIIEREVERQLNLFRIRDELKRRGVKFEDIKEEFYDVMEIFQNIGLKIIVRVIKSGGKVLVVKFFKFCGLIGKEIQFGRRFGMEMVDRVKKYVRGIFYIDELFNYGIIELEVNVVIEKFGFGEEDVFVFVVVEEEIVKNVFCEVIKRVREVIEGVFEEMRRVLLDGNI